MAFIRWDASFVQAYDNAQTYVRQLGWWQEDTDVCWRLRMDPPCYTLTGGSAGGAFAASLWHLLADEPYDFSVTISARITPEGYLLPVAHIERKIDEILKVPILSSLIVAADQPEVQAGPYGGVQIWKVRQAVYPRRH
jgi:hypothetical protein